MGDSTHVLSPPKTCRFCGMAMPTKNTSYGSDCVDLDATLLHFREHPVCRRQLIHPEGETQ